MRQLFLVTLLLTGFYGSLSANQNPMQFDRQKFEEDFDKLKQLEHYVSTHDLSGVQGLKKRKPELLKGVNLASSNTSSAVAKGWSFSDMEWGPFAWGFCCWPVGLFTVAINDDKSKNEKISYWIGAGTSTVVGGCGTFFFPVLGSLGSG